MQQFNPLKSYLSGEQAGEQIKAKQLANSLSQSDSPQLEPEFQQLMQIDPQRANAIAQVSSQGDLQRANAQLKDAKTMQYLMSMGDYGSVKNLLSERRQLIGGRPSEGTDHLINLMEKEDYQGVNESLNRYMSLFDPNYKPDGGKKKQTPGEKIQNYEYYQKLSKTNPDGAKRFAQSANLNPQERSSLAVETNKLKEQDKKRIDRVTGFASSGVEAADNLGSVKRTIELLDSVETGGFDNAAFKAKRLFGIEAADEGELSFLMSKNVLSQLKNIFGAAFTAQEGERLEKIEASFGRNTETNKRLLERVYKSTERAARRGIRAAEEIGDDFTANEIRVALERVKQAQDDDPDDNTSLNNQGGLSPEEQAELDALRRELGQ